MEMIFTEGFSAERLTRATWSRKLTVWSELDSGTEIELSIPAAIAYTTSPRRSWLSEKLFRKSWEENNAQETKPNS